MVLALQVKLKRLRKATVCLSGYWQTMKHELPFLNQILRSHITEQSYTVIIYCTVLVENGNLSQSPTHVLYPLPTCCYLPVLAIKPLITDTRTTHSCHYFTPSRLSLIFHHEES